MKKIILALATLAAIPTFISPDIAKADGTWDYMYNCPPQDFDRCWAAYKASSTSGWEAIKSNYHSMLAGCNRQDIAACSAHLSPSIVVRDANGQVSDLTRYRQSVQNSWQQTEEYRSSLYISSRDVGRDSATVTGIAYLDFTSPRSNNPAPMRSEANFEHTWKRTSNGWKMVSSNFQNQQVYAKSSNGADRLNQAASEYRMTTKLLYGRF